MEAWVIVDGIQHKVHVCMCVRRVTYTIKDTAWQQIREAIGLQTGQDSNVQKQETVPKTAKDKQSQRHLAVQRNKGTRTKAERQSYWQYVDYIIEIRDSDQQHQLEHYRFWSYIKSLWTRGDFMRTTRRKPTYWIGSMRRHGQERTQQAYQYKMAILSHRWSHTSHQWRHHKATSKAEARKKPQDLTYYLPEYWRNLLRSYHLTWRQSSREVSIQKS